MVPDIHDFDEGARKIRILRAVVDVARGNWDGGWDN